MILIIHIIYSIVFVPSAISIVMTVAYLAVVYDRLLLLPFVNVLLLRIYFLCFFVYFPLFTLLFFVLLISYELVVLPLFG